MTILVSKLSQTRTSAEGVALVAVEMPPGENQVTLWRYASAWFPTRCIFNCGVDSIGSGRDVATGRAVTLVNDEVVRSDPNLIAEVHFTLAEAIDQPPPFLLLPDTSAIPGCRRSRVRLHFGRLSELPDVQEAYQFSRAFDTNWAQVLPEFPNVEAPRPYSDDLLAKAEATVPASGLWLPFEVGRIQGAMLLGERRGDGVFDATLYVDRDVDAIKPSSLLRRSVTWTTLSNERGSAEADIATVLEVA